MKKKILLIVIAILLPLHCFSLGFIEMDAPPVEVTDTEKNALNNFVKSFYLFLDSDTENTIEATESWFYDSFIWVEVRHRSPDYEYLNEVKREDGVQALYKAMVDIHGPRKDIQFLEALYYKHIYDDPTPVYMMSYKVTYGEAEVIERFHITNLNGKYEIRTLFLFD